MRHLIAFLSLLACGQAFAQTCSAPWCLNSIGISAPAIAAGAAVTVSVGFTSSAAASGQTLDIEIYDPSGAKVAQSWQTGVNFAAGQTLIASPLVWTAAGTPGVYTVKVGTFTAAGANSYWNGTAATFTVTGQAPRSSSFTCLPKVQWPLAVDRGDVPAVVGSTNSKFAVWVCKKPYGYITVKAMFNYSDIVAYIEPYMDGMLSIDQANAIAAPLSTPATPAETAFLAAHVQTDRPKALVAFNGANPTRSIYTTNPDGTINTTAIAGESIAVGTPCDETSRITTATDYYSVAGKNDQNARPLQPGSFAFCVVSLPIGSN